MANNKKILSLTLFSTILLLSAISTVFITTLSAQTDATVAIVSSVGGTTDPSGTNTYPDGTTVTITATPTDDGFIFSNWVITTSAGDASSLDNPLTLNVVGGETYALQAVFTPLQPPPGATFPTNTATAAIVIVLPSAGGTTTPAAGTYALADATNMMLTATAQNGWQFSHWTICGTSTNHGGAPTNWAPTDNPYNVNHGYGYTYYYQAVFTPTGSNAPTPPPASGSGSIGGMSMETWIIIALVIVIVVIVVAFGAFTMRRKH